MSNKFSMKPSGGVESHQNGQEIKKIMTTEILKQTDTIFGQGKDVLIRKNEEEFRRYTSQAEQNYVRFEAISKDLASRTTALINSILNSKLGDNMKQLTNNHKSQTDPLFLKFNKLISQKTISIQANDYIQKKSNIINKFMADILADIEAFNKAGCCCSGKGTIKKKLELDIPKCFTVFIGFLEALAFFEGLPSKQEYQAQEYDVAQFKATIKNLIDQYFPVDNDVKIVTKEVVKEVYIDKPVEVIKYVDKYIEKYVAPQQRECLCKAHEFTYGLGTPQQVKKGIAFYERQQGDNLTAINCLGQIYFEGKIVEQDYETSYNYYNSSSQKEDPEGLYRLGVFYEKGLINDVQNQQLSQKDQLTQAFQLYKKAADKGHVNAIIDLGFIYENGLKTDQGEFICLQNLQQARTYYEKVDPENCPRACNNLGTLNFKQKNYTQALKNYRQAEQMKYPSGIMNLGLCYLKGLGVPQDLNKAMEYLKEAALKGNEESKLQYSYQLLQHASNYQNEDELFQVAIYLREILAKDQNNSDALLYLGFMHELGLGVAKDYKTSLKNYIQAAELKNDKAITKLADIYFSGQLLPKDITKAIQLYEEAASYGNTTAINNLGSIFEEGYDGQEPDYEKAYQYYMRAAENGSADAWTHIGLMLEMGRKKQNTSCESYQAFMRASQMGNMNSLEILKDKIELMITEGDTDWGSKEDLEKKRFLKDNVATILGSYRSHYPY